MTTIGYATLQIVPSLQGVSDSVNKQLGGALDGKKFGKAFGKDLAAGVKASEADVKKAFDNHAKLADKAADATGRLKVAQAGYDELIEKGVTTGKRYEAALAAKNKAQRDEARALKQTTDALKDYERAAKDAASAGETGGQKAGTGFLSGLSGAVTRASGTGSEAASSFAAGFAGSSALLRLGSAGGPIGLALAAAGVVGGGLLAKNVLAGVEREVGRDLVQARLGIDEASMARVADAAGKAYVNNFGESVQSNLGAVQSAIESGLLTDANDPGAQKVIEDLSTISALLGEEIPRVSRSASQLIRTGMAEDMTEAFDLIVKGQQAGLNVSEDWLDTLDEYSTQFRKLGLDGEQAMGLLSQMVKGGARDTDIAADALKEFSIRVVDGSKLTRTAFTALGLDADAMAAKFAEGGPAAAEAFDQTVDAIRGIEDPLARSQVAVALFGTQAEDLGGALNNLDLSTAVDQLGAVEGATQRASDTLGDSPAAAIESARRSIEQSLTDVQDSLALAFGPGLRTLANEVVEHTDDIKGAFVTIADFTLALGQDALLSFGQMIEAFGDVLNVVGDTAGGVVKALATVDRALHGETDNNRGMFEDAEMLFNLGEGARDTGRKMQGLADELGLLREEFRESTRGGDGLADSIKGVGTAAGTSLGQIAQLNAEVGKLPLGRGGAGNYPSPQPGIGQTPYLPSFNPGGGGRGAGLNLQIAAAGGPGGPGGQGWLSAVPGGGAPYGLKPGTDIRQGAAGFPDWVYQVADAFGLQASTYAGHQEDRGQGNQGIDWWGPPENQQAFADFLAANAANIPGLEDVIWQNPNTGQKVGVNQGRIVGVPGSADPGYFRDDFADHTDHVHTTQSAPIPLPGGGTPVMPSVAPASASAVIPQGATREQVIAGLAARARAEGLSEDEVAGVLALAQAESNFNQEGFLGFSTQTADTGYTGGAPYANDFNKAMDQFFQNYKQGGHAAAGGPEVLAAAQQALASGDAGPFLQWLQNGLQGAVAGQGGMNHEFGPNLSKFFNQWRGSTTGIAPGPNTSSAGLPSAALNSAFGAEYKPGIGTPGYDEYGEPGYYETDPRRIAQAERSAEDSIRRIAEADQTVIDTNADLADKIAERDRIAKLTPVQQALEGADLDEANAEVERLQAQLDRAKLDAERSREDAQWAQEDLAEAQKGTFSPAKEADKPSSLGGPGGTGFNLGTSLSGIGSALGEFAGGQIGSVLDVFGVPDSPGWLKGISTLISGISIGGGDSAAPLAASPNIPPMVEGNVHGTQAGQQPGPVYNIHARDTEDAFVRAQRIEREKSAAKLSRF